ncbi:MAG: NTP transferase domain-containing protein [Pseudomonadota bacterium]
MQGVILAAGAGSRLQALGGSKPLVALAGLSLLERVMATAACAGVDAFILVTGHEGEKVAAHGRDVAARRRLRLDIAANPRWREANGLSVLAAAPFVTGDHFLLMMCDHVVEPALIAQVLAAPRQGYATLLAIDRRLDNPDVDLEDVTRVALAGDAITAIGKGLARYQAYDCGVFCAHESLSGAIETSLARDNDASLSGGMRVLAAQGLARAHDIGAAYWVDVDDPVAHAKAHARLMDFDWLAATSC